MQRTARAIIKNPYNEDEIITIKRGKNVDNKYIEYYTFPGGHVEENETYEETVIRELNEELGIEVKVEKEFSHIYNNDLDREEVFFVCKYINGEIGTGNGPEFVNKDFEKYGSYEIVNLNLNELEKYNLLPAEIKEKIILNMA